MKTFMFRLRVWCFILLLILCGSSATGYFFYQTTQETLQIKLTDKILQIQEQTGMSLSYDSVDLNLFHPPRITGLKIIQANDTSQGFEISIPELTADADWQLYPEPQIFLHSLQLVEPKIFIHLDPETQTKPVEDLAQQGKAFVQDVFDVIMSLPEKQKLSELVLHDRLDLKWNNAELNFVDNGSTKDKTPITVYLKHLSGNVVFDFSAKEIALQINQKAINELLVDLLWQKKQNDLILSGTARNFLINPLKGYLPAELVLESDSQLNAQFQLFPLKPDEHNQIHVSVELNNVGLHYWRISEQPLNHLDVAVSGDVVFSLQDKSVVFNDLKIGTKRLNLFASGSYAYGDEPIVKVRASVPRTKIQVLLDDLPHDFVPVLQGAVVEGSVAMDLSFELDVKQPKALVFEPEITIEDYKLVKAPEQADVLALKNDFVHDVTDAKNKKREISISRKSGSFVSYHYLGKNIIKGVLTCEDGSFFRHEGFQLRHIRDSLIQNIKEKRFARGASTISMQLAKNLFLSGDKNISRKFQEVLLTYAMEQEITKERMLEIYMNIIEWGPGIYGIKQAARHYFDKKSEELSVLEAAYLGSIIANPAKYYYMYRKGEVSDFWANYLRVIVSKMKVEDEETDEEYRPVFVSNR